MRAAGVPLILGALLAAGLACGADAADAPLRLPGTTRPELTEPLREVPLPDPEPKVERYEPADCVSAGDTLVLVGRAFGEPEGKGVALGGNGVHVDLTVVDWTDRRIRVRVPSDSRLETGKRYYAAVERADHGEWLSNLLLGVEICAARAEEPTLAPGATAPRGFASEAGGAGGAPETGPASPPEPPPSVDPRDYRPRSGGSLMTRGLPAPPTVPADEARAEPESIEPREVVAVSPDMTAAQALAQRAQAMGFGLKRRHVLRGLGLVVTTLRTPDGMGVREALRRLREALPQAWLDANHRYRLQDAESGPRRYDRELLGWPAGPACGEGLRIGLLDTAVATSHPGLGGAAIESRSFLSAGVQRGPAAHGTAVAGLLVGQPGSGGFAGLLPRATLLAAEVVREREARTLDTTAEALARAISWLVESGAAAINVSLGGPDNLILRATVERVHAAGVAIAAAAGNGGPEGAPVYPAAYPEVLAVTALDARRAVYRRANRGEYIELAAPGVDLWVAHVEGGRYVSGTSYAAPYVTAAAALAARRAGSGAAARRALREAAADLGAPGRDPVFGWGMVRATGKCGGATHAP